MLLKVSDSIIRDIAYSGLLNSEIDDFTETSLITDGVMTASALNNRKNIINESLSSISLIVEDEICSTCAFDSTTSFIKLKTLAKEFRSDSTVYKQKMDSLVNRVAVALEPTEDGPGCNWAFYVCLAAASGATSGLGAAAAIYLCACSFCKVKPPGCN